MSKQVIKHQKLAATLPHEDALDVTPCERGNDIKIYIIKHEKVNIMINCKKMLKKISVLSLMLASCCVYADQAANQHLVTLLNAIQQAQGNFSQTIYTKQGAVLQQSKGTFALSRPGKFRWNTTSPSHQLLIVDGRYIWLYDKDLQQVTQQNQKTNQVNSPAFLLSGDVSQLSHDYTVSEANNAFTLVPKKETFFEKVKVSFKDQTLVSMDIYDNMDQETEIQFSNLSSTAPASLFKFTPPKGVDVVKG